MPLYIKIVMTMMVVWGVVLMSAMVLDVTELGPRWLRRAVGYTIVYFGIGGVFLFVVWFAAELLRLIWGVM